MNDLDLNEKVREALASTNGNRHDAQKLLIAWAIKDHELLLEMTRQHLKAIATALIEHVGRAAAASPPPKPQDARLTQKNLDAIFANPSDSGMLHDKKRRSNAPPPKSTETQASAMRILVEAYARKRDES